MVVQATNGATTTAGAFTLPRPLIAGAYTYYLFKGGVSAGTADNWYLRSSLAAAPTPTPAPAPAPAPTPTPTPHPTPTPTPTPTPAPSARSPPPAHRPSRPRHPRARRRRRSTGWRCRSTPKSRYSRAHSASQQIGTFHDRQGEQSLLNETGALAGLMDARLGRARHAEQRRRRQSRIQRHDGRHASRPGPLRRSRRQAASAITTASSRLCPRPRRRERLRARLPESRGRDTSRSTPTAQAATGRTSAQAAGTPTPLLMGSSLTHQIRCPTRASAPPRMATPKPRRSKPACRFRCRPICSIEPQAQLIWQHASINDLDDGISSVIVSCRERPGRPARPAAARQLRRRGRAVWEPYLRANLWRYFNGTDERDFRAARP